MSSRSLVPTTLYQTGACIERHRRRRNSISFLSLIYYLCYRWMHVQLKYHPIVAAPLTRRVGHFPTLGRNNKVSFRILPHTLFNRMVNSTEKLQNSRAAFAGGRTQSLSIWSNKMVHFHVRNAFYVCINSRTKLKYIYGLVVPVSYVL